MGEVGDGISGHLEIDLDGRAAQLGVSGGGGIGVRQPSEARNIPGEFDDPLVVDVVQHVMESSTSAPDRPWRAPFRVLYRGGTGGKTVQRCKAVIRICAASVVSSGPFAPKLFSSGVRRLGRPV